jgi:pimeloyl-ACP methyl ester carboxylesterase
MTITPFTVDVPESVLEDLRARIAATRWPDEIAGAGWEYGANLGYMRELAEYWRTRFDWRAQERAINALENLRVEIDGFGIHCVRLREKGPHPLPIILTHGWPSLFVEHLPLAAMLADPEAQGGEARDAFDVVVPSLPGFGFSDRPTRAGYDRPTVAAMWVELMRSLGYERFGAHASDVGATVTGYLGLDHAEHVIGIHTTMPANPWPYLGPGAPALSDAERAFLTLRDDWMADEGAYEHIQSTRPQTLAYGLNDSPVALAAWIIEKWRAWTDPQGDVEAHFSKDELLTNVTIYWVTQTINSANRAYYDAAHSSRHLTLADRVKVPTAVLLSTEEVERAPREFAERLYGNIVRWSQAPRGGHFIAAEEPNLVARDIRAFFRQLR